MLRVGLIGAGQVAERHAAAYAAHPDATVVAVADPDRVRGEALASRWRATWYASADALFATEDVEAVSVCVPHDLHLEIGLAAAKRSVHMLMEKPIATTLADADAIIAAARAGGSTLMIGFVHRFRAEVLEARRLLSEGAIGKPATALDRFCSLGGVHPPGWVWERARAGGGVLMYGGIHGIDRLLWLLDGTVDSVFARSHAYGGFGDVEDGLVALLEFAGGETGALFENSPPYGRPGGWGTEIFGTEGAIRIQTGASLELTAATRSFVLTTDDERHFERQIAEFVNAVVERREPSVSGKDGRDALAVALAIYASTSAGEQVAVQP